MPLMVRCRPNTICPVHMGLRRRLSRCETQSTLSCPCGHLSTVKEVVMPTESEAKILDIDPVTVAQVIIAADGRPSRETGLWPLGYGGTDPTAGKTGSGKSATKLSWRPRARGEVRLLLATAPGGGGRPGRVAGGPWGRAQCVERPRLPPRARLPRIPGRTRRAGRRPRRPPLRSLVAASRPGSPSRSRRLTRWSSGNWPFSARRYRGCT